MHNTATGPTGIETAIPIKTPFIINNKPKNIFFLKKLRNVINLIQMQNNQKLSTSKN